MTARLLSAGFADAEEPGDWVTTLRCCSAHEAYLRTYRRAVDGRPGRRVPAARPALPPLGLPRPGRGRGVPGRAPARRGPGRPRRRGPAHPGPGPHRPRVPPRRTSCWPTSPPTCGRCRRPAPRPATPWPAATSARPRPSSGACVAASAHDLAHRHHPHHRLPVPPGGDVVLQRGPHHADLQRPPAVLESTVEVSPPPSPTATGTTGAPSSTPSTSRCPTSSCRSPARRSWRRRAAPTRPTSRSAGTTWPSPDVRDRFAELLAPTTLRPRRRRRAGRGRRASCGSRRPAAACEAAVEWVKGSLRYEQGTTDVSTPAPDALGQGSGVCQDFAHLTLALLRAAGIPGRYVSGYLHPYADAGSARPSPARATPGSRRGRRLAGRSTPPTAAGGRAPRGGRAGPATTPTCRP